LVADRFPLPMHSRESKHMSREGSRGPAVCGGDGPFTKTHSIPSGNS